MHVCVCVCVCLKATANLLNSLILSVFTSNIILIIFHVKIKENKPILVEFFILICIQCHIHCEFIYACALLCS